MTCIDAVRYTWHKKAEDWAAGTVHGIFDRITATWSQKISQLQVSTHRDNKVLQHLTMKSRFQECGVVCVADGTLQAAYEKISQDIRIAGQEGVYRMETTAQRSVRHCLAMLAPFEASDEEAREGQEQFYIFMRSLYEGMYGEPEAWFVFPAPYEEYIKKTAGEDKPTKERVHAKDSRESTLRNVFQQAIQFYAMYFYNLGIQAEHIGRDPGALFVTKDAYKGILRKLGRLHEPQYNAQRLAVLERLGVCVKEEEGGIVRIFNAARPRMMEGIRYLCGAPESKYKWMNFLRMDYKNAYSPVPEVEDICKTLPEAYAAVIKRLEGVLAGRKIKVQVKPLRGIVSDFCWKVAYVQKGSNICGFYADNESFMLCIHFNNFMNISKFAEVLYEEDRGLFAWFRAQFPERLCKCPNNRRVSFHGEERRICGLCSRAEILDPAPEDVERALYVLRKYRGE